MKFQGKGVQVPKFSIEKSKHLLNNRIVLIFIFVLALMNIVQLVTLEDYLSVSVFVLVSFLTSFFSKNMIVILCIGMTVSNTLKYGTNIANPWKEGFAGDNEEDTEDKDTEDKDTEDKDTEDKDTFKNKNKKKTKKEDDDDKTAKEKLIEADLLDDLRHEMKLGFKRINQNIDSVGMNNLFI
jgi:hypothetical protein